MMMSIVLWRAILDKNMTKICVCQTRVMCLCRIREDCMLTWVPVCCVSHARVFVYANMCGVYVTNRVLCVHQIYVCEFFCVLVRILCVHIRIVCHKS